MERSINLKNEEIKNLIKKVEDGELQRLSAIQDSQKQIELVIKEKQGIA